MLIIVKWTLSEAIGDYINLHEIKKALGRFGPAGMDKKFPQYLKGFPENVTHFP